MRPRVLALAMGGIALAAVGLNLAASRIHTPAPSIELHPEAVPSATDQSRSQSQSQAVLPAPPVLIRPVAPEIVAGPDVDIRSLERVEQRQPLSPIGQVPDPADGPPRETILHRPVVSAAGSFEAMGYRVALEGIEVTPVEDKCGSDGWPCGVHARTAFRNWLRGRALTCVVPRVVPDEVVVTNCALAAHDPAAWLVEQGWARAVAGGPYEEAGQQALAAGRGLFGEAPVVALPPSGGEFAPQRPVDEGAGVVDPVERGE